MTDHLRELRVKSSPQSLEFETLSGFELRIEVMPIKWGSGKHRTA